MSSGSRPDAVFRQVRVDPVERTVILALDAALAPDTAYELRVFAADRPGDRLASFDGTPFEGKTIIPFRTKAKAEPGDTEDIDVDPGTSDPCAVTTLFASTCSGASCHGAPGLPPAVGLNLLTDRAIQETAVGKAAVMAQSAAHPGGIGAAPLSGLGFPRGLPLVDPRRGGSSTSFLLFKLLMRGPRELVQFDAKDGARLAACTSPTTCPVPRLAAPDLPSQLAWKRTMDDLSAVMPGSGMPHKGDFVAGSEFNMAPLTLAELRLVRAWIDGDEKHLPAAACSGSPPADAGADGDVGGADAADGAKDAPPEVATDGATDAASDTAPDG